MINKEIIRSFVLSNSNLTGRIDYDYVIPKNIKSKTGRPINIISNREEALAKNNSKYSFAFESDISNEGVRFIKEFPIVIDDKGLWNEVCSLISGEQRDTTYFLLDFYLVDYNLAVEIDSKFHDNRKDYDLERDIYLESRFGIETHRFYEYGKDDNARKKDFRKLKSRLRTIHGLNAGWGITNPNNCYMFIDIAVNQFIRNNRRALDFIDSLIAYIGITRFHSSHEVEVSYNDAVKIDGTLTIREMKTKGSLDQLFLDGVSLLLLQLYRKKFVIVP